jgi:nucleotide-binding universal stress UspA family protein
LRKILAAVDQSRHAHAVVSRAAELASLLREDLVVLTVLDPDPMRKFNIDEERNRISSFQRELIFKHFSKNGLIVESSDSSGPVYAYKPAGIRIHLKSMPGNPVDSICTFADQVNADLVIVGNRGLGGVGGLVLGSVSERVVHKCTRTVMVVKGESLEKSDWEPILDSQGSHQRLRTL